MMVMIMIAANDNVEFFLEFDYKGIVLYNEFSRNSLYWFMFVMIG